MNKELKDKTIENHLDEYTSIRVALVLDKLGITIPDAKDLAGYLFSLMGEARRKIEVLKQPNPPLMNAELKSELLDALKSGALVSYLVKQEFKINNIDQTLEKIRVAIAKLEALETTE